MNPKIPTAVAAWIIGLTIVAGLLAYAYYNAQAQPVPTYGETVTVYVVSP